MGQKEEIIRQCKFHIRRVSPILNVPRGSACCVEVRKVRDMQCIIKQMGHKEKKSYSRKRVAGLEKKCH